MIPDNDSYAWPVLIGLVIGLTATAALWGNYKSVDTRDCWTVVEVLLAYFVAHWGTKTLQAKGKSDEA